MKQTFSRLMPLLWAIIGAVISVPYGWYTRPMFSGHDVLFPMIGAILGVLFLYDLRSVQKRPHSRKHVVDFCDEVVLAIIVLLLPIVFTGASRMLAASDHTPAANTLFQLRFNVCMIGLISVPFLSPALRQGLKNALGKKRSSVIPRRRNHFFHRGRPL